jgi:prephenate dehydrogenase
VTDAGSVKGAILRAVESTTSDARRFVGAHPLAGSHLAGFEHADAELYQDRLCVLTPASDSASEAVRKVRAFWEGLGMRVREMSADDHDRVLAITSHLPHLAAAAVALLAQPEDLQFASSGFRDTTRVAAGDPELWTAIFSLNAEELAKATDRLLGALQSFRAALAAGNDAEIQTLLADAQALRLQFRDGGEHVLGE